MSLQLSLGFLPAAGVAFLHRAGAAGADLSLAFFLFKNAHRVDTRTTQSHNNASLGHAHGASIELGVRDQPADRCHNIHSAEAANKPQVARTGVAVHNSNIKFTPSLFAQ